MSIKRIVAAALIVVAAAFAIFGIVQGGEPKQSGKLSVTASYYTVYDFTRNVGGNKIDLSNITPAGAEPHDYEPSAKQLAEAQKADVFVYNGEALETWTHKFVDNYKGTAIMSAHGISLMKDNNPHFWLDPVLAQKMVTTIRDGLIKADPTNKAYYTANAKAYNQKLAALDQAYKTGLQGCKQHTVVTSHDALGYLSVRYGFDTEPIAGLSPDEEPSAARLAEISDTVTRQGIKYIFFESLVSPRLADTIATETGAKTLVFDPIEGLTESAQKDGKNYLTVQYENLKNLRTALACS